MELLVIQTGGKLYESPRLSIVQFAFASCPTDCLNYNLGNIISGTIDKDYPRTQMGYAFEIGDPAAKNVLERMNLSGWKVTYKTLCKKDSQDITEEDR